MEEYTEANLHSVKNFHFEFQLKQNNRKKLFILLFHVIRAITFFALIQNKIDICYTQFIVIPKILEVSVQLSAFLSAAKTKFKTKTQKRRKLL
jgi:hypothetical protein